MTAPDTSVYRNDKRVKGTASEAPRLETGTREQQVERHRATVLGGQSHGAGRASGSLAPG